MVAASVPPRAVPAAPGAPARHPFALPDAHIPRGHPIRRGAMPLAAYRVAVTRDLIVPALTYALRLGLVEYADWLYRACGRRIPLPPFAQAAAEGGRDATAWLLARCPATAAVLTDIALGCAAAGDRAGARAARSRARDLDAGAVARRLAELGDFGAAVAQWIDAAGAE